MDAIFILCCRSGDLLPLGERIAVQRDPELMSWLSLITSYLLSKEKRNETDDSFAYLTVVEVVYFVLSSSSLSSSSSSSTTPFLPIQTMPRQKYIILCSSAKWLRLLMFSEFFWDLIRYFEEHLRHF